MNGGNTRRAECAPSFLFDSLQKPQDACWRRPPPSIAISSVVKEGIKQRKRGKVIFFPLTIHSFSGFLPLFSVNFHKAYNYLSESPSSENEWSLCTLLSSALSCFWEEGSHINIWSSPSTDAERKPAVSLTFQQLNFTNTFSESQLSRPGQKDYMRSCQFFILHLPFTMWSAETWINCLYLFKSLKKMINI